MNQMVAGFIVNICVNKGFSDIKFNLDYETKKYILGNFFINGFVTISIVFLVLFLSSIVGNALFPKG